MMQSNDESGSESSDSGDASFIASENSTTRELAADLDGDASYAPEPDTEISSSSSSEGLVSESDAPPEMTRVAVAMSPDVVAPLAVPAQVVSAPAPEAGADAFRTPPRRNPKRERRVPTDIYLERNARRVQRVLDRDRVRDLLREAADRRGAAEPGRAEVDAVVNAGVSLALLEAIGSVLAERDGMAPIDEARDADDTDADAETDSDVEVGA